MDLIKAIRIFIAVTEHSSYTAVARQNQIAVSAVSRYIVDLEQHFSCQLLHRTTRTMKLSAEGKALLPEFKELIARLDNLQSASIEKSRKIKGKIILSSPYHSEGLGINEALCKFCAAYPDVDVVWKMQNHYVNLIDEGVDVAVRVGKLPDSTLIARKYDELDIVFIASPAYLARYGVPASPELLDAHHCVAEQAESGFNRWRYQDQGKEKFIAVKGQMTVNKPNMVAMLAAAGQGIAQLPKYMVQHYIDAGALVTVMDSYQPEPLALQLVYPSSQMLKPAARVFIDFFLNSVAEHRTTAK